MKKSIVFSFLILLFSTISLSAQKTSSALEKLSLSALKFRSIGPAKTSGRIADIAVNPEKFHEYYVAVASGGVWKTINSGNTFTPIFDSQGSYSIGCVTMDPSNPNIIWVGTGENNNQRSVAYGDGIYRSMDGGSSWTNMGLKTSEHISKIIVHPTNSNIIWVAATGPLWNKGGERGIYKSIDAGATWKRTLDVDVHTGASDLIIDPRNPDRLFAAMHQRARHVYTYLGGGPGSGIYKSDDGGDTWSKAMSGLPSVDLGRIGLAIAKADSEILYAIVEAAKGKSGFYRSTNRGASWHKRGGHVTSGNYYQEIMTDPIDPDRIYSMDTWLSMSKDGGKTFKKTGEISKHVDNHSIWINPNNNNHWLVGCDGGIYETWDGSKNWDYKANLPVTQFYKVSVDNDLPFYNIYGGTQDNSSMGGPSRTLTAHGIVNSDWYITHGGDGFETQVDPNNPDIVYSQSQYGVLARYDRRSGEEVGIQPKERKDELAYRWNWDAPLVASPHKSGRLYFAANKVFRSDDYGNSWEVISDDLTRGLDRNKLKIMDRVWSLDAVAKNRSTSPYGTIVAFAESRLDAKLLVAGSDEGLINISNDGGDSWSPVGRINGAPTNSYVNTVFCSKHDVNVIYAAFNHHKYGDFKPYLFKSSDRGRSWKSISKSLPVRGSVYSFEEDHVSDQLIFCGTEFGVFVSPDAGVNWKQLKSGVPTIAVRDLAIQERENDLVLGTFGRGFYVLDDYSSLRNLTAQGFKAAPMIFDVRQTLSYEEARPLGLRGKAMQGDAFYSGEDLGPVALIDYHYDQEHVSIRDKRRKKEKKQSESKLDSPYPDYETYKAEGDELETKLIFTITDAKDQVIAKLSKKPSKGLSRLKWNMRYKQKSPVNLSKPAFYNPWAGRRESTLVAPGVYKISMQLLSEGKLKDLAATQEFEIKRLEDRVMPAKDVDAKVAFQKEVEELSRSLSGTGRAFNEIDNKMKHIREAINLVEQPMSDFLPRYYALKDKITKLKTALYGDGAKSKLDIDQIPSPSSRLGWIMYEQKYSTSAPTGTHMMSLAIAKEEFAPIVKSLESLIKKDLDELENMLEDADAPYTPGRAIKMIQDY